MLSVAVRGRRTDRTGCLDRIHTALNVVTAGRNGAAVLTRILRGVARAIGARTLRVELSPDASRIQRRPTTHVVDGRTRAAECSQPLDIGGRRLGVLYAEYSGACPTPSDQSRLALAAHELAVTLDRVAGRALDHICDRRMDEVIG